MAGKEVSTSCGKTQITYNSTCGYTCLCPPGANECHWMVTCPDGKGGFLTTTGSGRIDIDTTTSTQHHPMVTVAGNLAAICANLQELSPNRRMVVPAELHGKQIAERSFSGTPEALAHELGFKVEQEHTA